MKKVLVIGGCGYLGARLSKYLAESGYGVTAFDSFNPSEYYQWISLMEEVIVGDIRDETTISKLTEKEYDAVIHLISLDHRKSEDNPNIVSSINVMPTWNLLDKFAKKGLRKFIYFSTIQVYGEISHNIITEEHAPSPQNTYGLTHLLSENICNYFNWRTDTTCINVRLSNSYGSPVFKENNCWWLVINDLVKTAYTEKKIILSSDGSPQRDFIHTNDIYHALDILINQRKSKYNTFHICSGETHSILEVAHLVKDAYKNRYNDTINVFLSDNSISEDPLKFSNSEKFNISNSKLTSLKFNPRIKIKEGIDEIFTFLEKQYDFS